MKSSCSLTKQELDAVLQLIQLSGGAGDDLRIFWMDFAGGGAAAAEASSSISSSSSINEEEMMDDEPLPRTNHKFGSLIDIYGKTINNHRSKNKKRARF